jgi:UDP-glucuronate decarboxylase
MFSHQEVTGPINLGNPREFTMLELAQKVIKTTNSNSIIEFRELPQDDPKQRRPDITKAQNVLNWNPLVDLEKGLALTVAEFTTRL